MCRGGRCTARENRPAAAGFHPRCWCASATVISELECRANLGHDRIRYQGCPPAPLLQQIIDKAGVGGQFFPFGAERRQPLVHAAGQDLLALNTADGGITAGRDDLIQFFLRHIDPVQVEGHADVRFARIVCVEPGRVGHHAT